MDPEIHLQGKGIPGKGPFLFSAYPDGGPVTFSSSGHIALVFVLEGCAVFDFPFQKQILRQDELTAVDKRLLKGCSCHGNSALMEYLPQQDFARYLELGKTAFRRPYSGAVPILPPVKQWIRSLFEVYAADEEQPEGFWHAKREELTSLLLGYPEKQLGELYAAFYACYKIKR